MPDHPHHQSLRLQNFTAFKDTELEFVPGVNAFVGENGTGKTHVMKAMYAAQLPQSRRGMDFSERLQRIFQTTNITDLIRLGTAADTWSRFSGAYSGQDWVFDFQSVTNSWTGTVTEITNAERPVFIPAIDMMGHTKGFIAAANEINLDFDQTIIDIVSLLSLERSNLYEYTVILNGISELLGGDLEYNPNDGRFFLVTDLGRLAMPLVAEGLRKIATLLRLVQNKWLTPGTTLFWDEPEVNLNPKLMDEVVGAILQLTRQGIQVFIATHSYVILKELDLQAKQTDTLRYFSFERAIDGTKVNSCDDFISLDPNPILEQYNYLYDRELTRATGRNQRGEHVR